MPNSKTVHIYTDGSCLGNPGPGGYGIVMEYGSHHKEMSQGYKLTTNNRMEMMATIVALKALKRSCDIVLSTDSQYVAAKKPVKNQDLWVQLDEQVRNHKIKWQWVKGHSGHPQNERCDELARDAASREPLLEDTGFKPD